MGYVLCPCCQARLTEESLDGRLCKPCRIHCTDGPSCEVRFMSKHEIRRTYE